MIQIPGYKLVRQLGKGGMATVYLAVQTSVDREVALKIMAPQLSLDPSFGERFLREARISAKLHHRHVVAIFDVGVHQDIHYIAMEFVSGGPIMGRDGNPVEPRLALRCIREIASALDYAHSKGFIHRDVKPDNILLRDDQSCVLSDFGIARASDSSTVMTKTGSVVGTPHYMSPEALRGLKIDGRSDLYSLGVVFYQLLTGEVPYQASDSLAIGIMHMTAPLPVVPREFGYLQPLMQRMMAKKPEERVQSGAEVVRLVQQLEAQLKETPLPTPMMQASRMTGAREQAQPEMRARERTTMDLDPDAVSGVRTEPQLGRLEEVGHETWREPLRGQTEFSRRAAAPRSSRDTPRRIWPWVLLIFLCAAIGAGIWWRVPMTAWLKREFPIVFGAEPPQIKVPGTEPPPPVADPKVDAPPTGQATIDSLRAAAARAEREGRWFNGRDSALYQFAELKRLAPGDRSAAEGYAEALKRVLAEIERLLKANDFAGAEARINELAGADPSAPQLRELKKQLDTARNARLDQSNRIEQLLAEAADAFERGRLTGSTGAAERYRAVLKIAPDNATARLGLSQTAQKIIDQARVAVEAGKLTEATNLLNTAQNLGVGGKEIRELKERMEVLRYPSETQLSAADDLQLQTIVEQGSKAIAEGDWVRTPAASGFDRLRAAQKISRTDPRVERLEDQLIAALKGGVDQAIAEGEFESAVEWADSLKALAARDRAIEGYINRVADAIANAARSNAAGAPDTARTLLRLLKQFNNKHPAVAELEARLSG